MILFACAFILACTVKLSSSCFVSPSLRRHERSVGFSVNIDGYREAFDAIDECAVSGIPADDLFGAVRFIDKNSLRIYPSDDEKHALWDRAHGSWKLQLATGGGKYRTFKKVPIFAFACIDEENFGNGIGIDEDNVILSLLGPHVFAPRKRQMIITIDDIFLFGSKSTALVPAFIKDGMGIGKRPEDFEKRPPTFTMIGASDEALIARGGTGGIAIWTRLAKDIRPAAYGKQE